MSVRKLFQTNKPGLDQWTNEEFPLRDIYLTNTGFSSFLMHMSVWPVPGTRLVAMETRRGRQTL